jgi:hypothetical protein
VVRLTSVHFRLVHYHRRRLEYWLVFLLVSLRHRSSTHHHQGFSRTSSSWVQDSTRTVGTTQHDPSLGRRVRRRDPIRFHPQRPGHRRKSSSSLVAVVQGTTSHQLMCHLPLRGVRRYRAVQRVDSQRTALHSPSDIFTHTTTRTSSRVLADIRSMVSFRPCHPLFLQFHLHCPFHSRTFQNNTLHSQRMAASMHRLSGS